VETLVVGNGTDPPVAPPTRVVALDENIGIPAGRNRALGATSADIVLFLDDDAELLGNDVAAGVIRYFRNHPSAGVVALRLVDEDGTSARRHIPRIRGRRPGESGWVASFPGGAVAIRRDAMVAVGGYADDFFYGMEETDLALRLVDAGWGIWYAADLKVFHPRTDPSRHPDALWRTARNRVWLAHRNLPAVVAVTYLATWGMVSLVRNPGQWRSLVSGYVNGWRTRIGPRRPMSWATVWRLSLLGRPPVI
jgi:GT2 family glycosyltransferase